jgi:GT2 family glycosyltransferase
LTDRDVLIVVPTLGRDRQILDCLESLARQTHRNFFTVVVDNSGEGALRQFDFSRYQLEVIEARHNLGYGGAVNSAYRRHRPRLLAVLNDDATAGPEWLEALTSAMDSDPLIGMCASRVLLDGGKKLDSAGMLIARDGSSKQRGHGADPAAWEAAGDVLLPSGSAALYRGAMLDEIGLFDPRFFLYCEDTDLGLRARWSGWRCRYVPGAIVEHHYSRSAGRASVLKAYYVERNRLFLAVKNFPLADLAATPLFAVARYFWHVRFMAEGRGKAAEFRAASGGAWRLAWYVVKAHLAVLPAFPQLLRQRAAIRRQARLSTDEFRALLRRYAIKMREVAAL